MARHECVCGESSSHVEHGGRVQSIWARLQETGLLSKWAFLFPRWNWDEFRCEKVTARKAPLDQLRLVHSSTYVTFFAVSPTACLKMEASELPVKSFVQLPCGGIGIDSDTYFNDNSTQLASRVAAGSLIELATSVMEGRIRNGFACIRPPGHHAERDQAMGFCFFNNVAICARQMQVKYPQQRIAIIDWDVHHGNGTQLCFEDDPNVLYLSMHRHDNGNFFPGTGAVTDIGRGQGKVRIPFLQTVRIIFRDSPSIFPFLGMSCETRNTWPLGGSSSSRSFNTSNQLWSSSLPGSMPEYGMPMPWEGEIYCVLFFNTRIIGMRSLPPCLATWPVSWWTSPAEKSSSRWKAATIWRRSPTRQSSVSGWVDGGGGDGIFTFFFGKL